ncbi:hypothetical protein [Prevotella falsenii]|nr:hypothetical protein [Prevotella falsenii]
MAKRNEVSAKNDNGRLSTADIEQVKSDVLPFVRKCDGIRYLVD